MPIFKLFAILAALTTQPGEIDRHLDQIHQRHGMTAGQLCDDDTFLRRISLDIIGRIPTRDELHRFRANPDRPDKIDQLLADDRFAEFWSEVWTAALVGYPPRGLNVSREPLRVWLEDSIRDGVAYNEIAARLIAAEGDSAFDGPVNFLLRHRQEPAVKVSRMFLGVRLDCARCHDHPFDRWTSEDFERFNLFFQSAQYQQVSQRNVRVIETPRQASADELPRFLTGAQPRTSRWRDELALFVTTCRPFARNFSNRVWYQLMGQGIVDPRDDFVAGAAVAPDLLEYLADYAKESEFDLRSMIRLICNSNAYQRESGYSSGASERSRLFALYRPKPLTPQQLVDSIDIALDQRSSEEQRRAMLARIIRPSLQDDHSETWRYRDTVQDVMTRLVRQHRIRDTSIASIYERILSRRPTQRELDLCRSRPKSEVVFALINSNEFRFSH